MNDRRRDIGNDVAPLLGLPVDRTVDEEGPKWDFDAILTKTPGLGEIRDAIAYIDTRIASAYGIPLSVIDPEAFKQSPSYKVEHNAIAIAPDWCVKCGASCALVPMSGRAGRRMVSACCWKATTKNPRERR